MKKCFYDKCNGNGTLNINASACTVEETDYSLNTEPLEPQLRFALSHGKISTCNLQLLFL